MFRLLIVLLSLFSTLSYAQISNDSLQKLLIGTEAQIKFYSKNPKLFTPTALASIGFHIDILKSINVYQDKSRPYFKKVKTIDSSFTLLKIKTNYLALDSTETEKIICQIERTFKKREAEIIGLKIENQNLRKQNYYLRMDTIRWSERCKKAKENEAKWKYQSKILEKKIKLYEHGTYWGLSLGFNYFLNNPPNYYIKPDSTIGTIGSPKGISFLVSAIVGYKFNEKNSFIFNVPLGDFTRNSQNAIGLFNQKLAGGLGYGYHISGVAVIGIINISPYEKLAPELLDGKKIEGDVYSKIDLKDYPTSTAYSPSFTLGMSYNFVGKPAVNTSE
jgi:hypothetical protein